VWKGILTALQIPANAALVMIDVQRGFDRADRWGRRDNPGAEVNMMALQKFWLESSRPVVVVQHDSKEPGSTLSPADPGNALKDFVDLPAAALHVRKSVNSAFYGTPDLEEWLRANKIDTMVICGITTNHCCETTARMAGNLGFTVYFVADATHTFDQTASNGMSLTAEELTKATIVSLDAGEFATVVTTNDVVTSASL
jgi:nicotinamidase-related amidase